jgi:glycosyltransferase involved in cell wall biosynthesis
VNPRRLNIAYVGEFRYPKGDAASLRVNSLGSILRNLGHSVLYIGKTFHDRQQTNGQKGLYAGFEYINIGKANANIFSRAFYYFFGGYIMRRILACKKIDLIILYGGSTRYLIPLKTFAKKHGIKLILDLVEWYDYSHLPLGKWGPFALDVHYSMTRLAPTCDGIIAISSFLENYYTSAGCKVIRIPSLIDNSDSRFMQNGPKVREDDYLNIVYAGFPGKKDLIQVVVTSIQQLNEEGYKIKLHIIGPAKSEFEKICSDVILNPAASYIKFYGRVDQALVPKLLSNCDFSILVRPDFRYANAGFPTKFVESLASGVPVITNLTSDIGLYLKNGEQGFVLNDCSQDSVLSILRYAYTLDTKSLLYMKKVAKETAAEKFHFSNYSKAVSLFLERCFPESGK